MRIKLHNSVTRITRGRFARFIFDDKIIILLFDNNLCLYLQIDDYDPFIGFDPDSKEFEELPGFGGNRKFKNPNYWKSMIWKEI